jgi:hypothetical protein
LTADTSPGSMRSMSDRALQHAVATLQDNPDVDVAFAIDAGGSLLTWAGSSAAFSPTGHFTPRAADEGNHNLFLVAISGERYLGIVFRDGANVDDVQTLLDGWHRALGPDEA